MGSWAPPTSDPEAEGEGEVSALGVGGVISGSEGPLLASNCAESCMSDCMMAEMAFSWDCSLLLLEALVADGSPGAACRLGPAAIAWGGPAESAGEGCCGV